MVERDRPKFETKKERYIKENTEKERKEQSNIVIKLKKKVGEKERKIHYKVLPVCVGLEASFVVL